MTDVVGDTGYWTRCLSVEACASSNDEIPPEVGAVLWKMNMAPGFRFSLQIRTGQVAYQCSAGEIASDHLARDQLSLPPSFSGTSLFLSPTWINCSHAQQKVQEIVQTPLKKPRLRDLSECRHRCAWVPGRRRHRLRG